jgi:hypothetical protein
VEAEYLAQCPEIYDANCMIFRDRAFSVDMELQVMKKITELIQKIGFNGLKDI